MGRIRQRCAWAAGNMKLHLPHRDLRVVDEAGSHLASLGIELDPPWQSNMSTEFIGNNPDAEEVSRFGGALVDGALQGVFEPYDVEFHATELGRIGTPRRSWGKVAGLSGIAGAEAVRCARVQRHPFRQNHVRVPHVGGGQASRGFVLGNLEVYVQPSWSCRFRGSRGDLDSRTERQF